LGHKYSGFLAKPHKLGPDFLLRENGKLQSKPGLAMSKHKFAIEFEINTSPKMIYPYLSTPNGLAAWFAEGITTVDAEEKIYDIVWDGTSHLARQVSNQTNKHVKFLFIDEQDEDPAYLEFKIAFNDLTETTFLKIIDYSDMVSDNDLRELWNNLVHALLELIGAKTASR
jgi:uncharacterized protein YndB with AHSA1/START domain